MLECIASYVVGLMTGILAVVLMSMYEREEADK